MRFGIVVHFRWPLLDSSDASFATDDSVRILSQIDNTLFKCPYLLDTDLPLRRLLVCLCFFFTTLLLSYAKKMWKFAHRINDKFRKSIKPLSGLALGMMTTTTTMMEKSNANALSLPNTMRYLASAIVVFATAEWKQCQHHCKRSVSHTVTLSLFISIARQWNCLLANAVNFNPKKTKDNVICMLIPVRNAHDWLIFCYFGCCIWS